MELERAISLYASAISNYAKLKKEVTGGRSSGTTHKGFTHLKNADHYAVAAHILKVNWHGDTAARATFAMGERVQALLHLNLDWSERFHQLVRRMQHFPFWRHVFYYVGAIRFIMCLI